MASPSLWNRIFGGPLDRRRWKDLLRSSGNPRRTAFAAALGAMVGATPLLGLHTWVSVSLATLFRLPPLTVILGSNLSNPLTFVPLTLAEIRVGQWLLGMPAEVLPAELSAGALGRYVGAAWMGYLVIGPGMALVTFAAVWLGMRTAERSRRPAVSLEPDSTSVDVEGSAD